MTPTQARSAPSARAGGRALTARRGAGIVDDGLGEYGGLGAPQRAQHTVDIEQPQLVVTGYRTLAPARRPGAWKGPCLARLLRA